MRLWHGVVVLFGTVLFSSCGGPSVGASCSAAEFACEDTSTALECRAGKWTTLQCHGPKGCSVANNTVSCDISGNQAGEACAAQNETQAICGPGGTSVLTCREGKFVKTQDCSTCTKTVNAENKEEISCRDQ